MIRSIGPALALTVVVTAAGCSDDDDTVSTGDSVVVTSGVQEPATTAGAGTSTSVADDVQLLVVLTADGIGFTTQDSGSVSRLDFGSDQQLTRDTVVKSLGEPAGEGTQEECGEAPHDSAWWGDILLAFDDGEFVGWSIDRQSELTTADGIGLGSTLDEVEAAIGPADVTEGSLGREFTAGAYWGLLDGSEDVVDFLSAGTICTFR
jgi:hypothetical protein